MGSIGSLDDDEREEHERKSFRIIQEIVGERLELKHINKDRKRNKHRFP